MIGGTGHDRLYGGRGEDFLVSLDHRRDIVSGGAGFDNAYFDRRIDRVTSVELDELTGGWP